MKSIRYYATALVVLILAALFNPPAEAGSVSRGGSSFSPTRAAASPPRSLGVQRPAPAPAPAPKPTAQRAATPPVAAATTVTPTVAPSPSGGGFLSSFAGGAAGAVVGNALSSPHHSAGTTVVASPVAANGEPVAVTYAQPVASSFGFARGMLDFVFGMVILAMVVCGSYVLWQRWKRAETAQRRLEDAASAAPPFYAVLAFLAVQRAFAKKDVDALGDLCSPNMLAGVLNDLPAEPGEMTIAGTSCSMLLDSDTLKTVRYEATDTADNTKLRELWHWVRDGKAWKLDGIQQID